MTLTDLCIGYKEKVVQRALNLDLASGQLVSLLGPNGSGKSTLLRTLAGLQPALSGQVLIDGQDIMTISTMDRAKKQALVLTESEALDATTVHNVVAMGRYPYTSFLGHLSDADETIIRQSLEAVGFPYSSTSKPLYSQSSGNRARIQLARALAQQTPIILLDEPTAHLDLPGRIQLFELLQRLAHEQHKLILISTHELDLALRMTDQCLLLSENGYYIGTPDALKQANAFEQAFKMKI